jgi:hypothetical protein
LLREKKRK